MHFDDRLGTVLRLRADGAAVRRIQFRQLIDLLGTIPAHRHGPQIDEAYDRLHALAGELDPREHRRLLADPGLRLRSPRLVATLAQADPALAQAALMGADLSEAQWLDLVPALPIAARGHVRSRRDLGPRVEAQLRRLGIVERGLPDNTAAAKAELAPAAGADDQPPDAERAAPAPTAAEAAAEPPAIASPPPPPPPAAMPADPARIEAADGIGAIVRRIEAYRRARLVSEADQGGDAPRLPLGEEPVLRLPHDVRGFDFATDGIGRIVWCDPGVAPMVLGLSLAGPDPAGSGDPRLGAALKGRQPLRAIRLAIAGPPPVAGAWQVDAAPWFDPLNGRHLGWRGRMRRPAEPAAAPPAPAPVMPVSSSPADRMRQMLHELRTPVNAVQGFAEVIQQQLFGPVPHEYRALSAGIAADAARMLAAFEELERLARLDSGAMALEAGTTDLAAVVTATVDQLGAHTRQRASGFAVRIDAGPQMVPLAQIEVERIVWRLLATLAGVAAPGELLKLRLKARHGMARLDVGLPATLAARGEDEVMAASAGAIPQVIAAGVFGVGFALRLVRAEALATGGRLEHRADRLRLLLPGLTGLAPVHSDEPADPPLASQA